MQYEVEIRTRIRETFQRGKIDVLITVTGQGEPKVSVNSHLAKKMYEAFGQLQQELALPGTIGIEFFAGYRDLLLQSEPSADRDALFRVLEDAIACLRAMREAEGEAMVAELSRLLDVFESNYRSDCAASGGVVSVCAKRCSSGRRAAWRFRHRRESVWSGGCAVGPSLRLTKSWRASGAISINSGQPSHPQKRRSGAGSIFFCRR
jgi:hypothetical protein